MNLTIILNPDDEVAFLHDEALDIEPEWASIDVELGELRIFNTQTGEQSLKLDEINQKIYERICKEEKVLLVQIENNDATKPIKTQWVHLLVSTQI